jgi:uncharacterized protein (DUF2062 family)
MRWRNKAWFKHVPTKESILEYQFLDPVRHHLDHHGLWQFNRRSVAGGAAIGLFFALAIPVAQIPVAAIVAIFFRVNIPIAIFGTLLSNPFTTPPLLYFAYKVGAALIGHDTPGQSIVLPDGPAGPAENQSLISGVIDWIVRSFEWIQSAGWPLVIGLGILSVGLSIAGYVAVHVIWRLQASLRWKKRCNERRQKIQ